MSILSDSEIIELCRKPTHVVEREIILPSKRLQMLTETRIINELVFSNEEDLNRQKQKSVYNHLYFNFKEATEEELIKHGWKPLIEPFSDRLVNANEKGEKIISYGLSSFGYDLRCGYKFKIFTNVNSSVADPKELAERTFVDVEVEKDGDFIIIPPNSFCLTYALEKINMPRDLIGVVLGKSTYARVGINCLATPAEAGWSGHLTLEFANTTPLPVKLYAGEGCCQVLFLKGKDCLTSYLDRNGKYQNQPAEVVLPRT